MAKKNTSRRNESENTNQESDLIKITIQKTPQLKSQICKVLYIKPTMFAIDFQGYGISICTNGSLIDADKIEAYIEIKYESEIGQPDFKFYPVYN